MGRRARLACLAIALVVLCPLGLGTPTPVLHAWEASPAQPATGDQWAPSDGESRVGQFGTRFATVRRGAHGLPTVAFDTEPAPDGHPMRVGSLLVKFRSGASQDARAAAHRQIGPLAVEAGPTGETVRVQVRPNTADQALAAYRARPDVERAEPDYVVRATLTPNDPRFAEQWGVARIAAPAAWDRVRGAAGIKVAILDCGIYGASSRFVGPDGRAGHVDLRDKIVDERDFTSSPNGADDLCDHGTHVAGIAAASTNNGIGVAGVGFDVGLLNGKVLGDDGSGTISTLISGITWATDNGARVISMSLGSAAACPGALQEAVDYAWARGVVLVAAAGNDGANRAETPANCQHVIAVAATDQNDGRAGFSNYGTGVSVAAPGVGILSTNLHGGYAMKSGTSMATPYVAGLAALLWASGHGTGSQAVVDRITATADRIAGTGSLWTAGRINAASAVGATSAPAPAPAPTPTAVPTPSPTSPPAAAPTMPPTPAPTPPPAPCAPRPNVRVSATPSGPGRLQVTLAAGTSASLPSNRLQAVRFGTPTNGSVDAGTEVGATGSFTLNLPAGTQQYTFVVRRGNPGQPTTVPLFVVDDCGDWSTIVGGGPTAF